MRYFIASENRYIWAHQAFELNEIQYPSNWISLATNEEINSLGLQAVTIIGERKNDKFYWVSETLNGASLTYTNTPKDLDTCKANEVNATNATAYSILLPSDWMVVKAFETSTPMDAAWSTWRAQIRSQAATEIAAINACTTIEQLAALPNVDWAKDPNAPVDPA